jgi:hypothetical protein
MSIYAWKKQLLDNAARAFDPGFGQGIDDRLDDAVVGCWAVGLVEDPPSEQLRPGREAGNAGGRRAAAGDDSGDMGAVAAAVVVDVGARLAPRGVGSRGQLARVLQ